MSKNKEFKDAVKEAKAAKIPVIRMIKNNLFMVKYATKYDNKLVLSVITLFCILQVLRAVQSTIILKIIIDMLQGDGSLKNLLLVSSQQPSTRQYSKPMADATSINSTWSW